MLLINSEDPQGFQLRFWDGGGDLSPPVGAGGQRLDGGGFAHDLRHFREYLKEMHNFKALLFHH